MDAPFIATLEAIRLSDMSRNGSFPTQERRLLSIMEKIKGKKNLPILFLTSFLVPLRKNESSKSRYTKTKTTAQAAWHPARDRQTTRA